MHFTRRLLVPASLLVLTAVLGGCASQGSGQRFYAQPSNEFGCVAASDFSKCRIERDKYSLAPTVRPGRR